MDAENGNSGSARAPTHGRLTESRKVEKTISVINSTIASSNDYTVVIRTHLM